MENYNNKQIARAAGLCYLIVVLTGIFSLAYVPGKLIVWDNAAQTYQNIGDAQTFFRLGILSNFICYIAFLCLPFLLYQLLKSTNKNYALLMVVFVVVSVPISFININNKFAVLSLLSNEEYLKIFSFNQLQAQVMFYLNQFENGNQIVEIFWGLWLLPLGLLIYQSNILPKILGVFLIIGCFSYLINFVGNTVSPNYSNLGIESYISIPASIAEISTCLWLLIMGAKERQL